MRALAVLLVAFGLFLFAAPAFCDPPPAPAPSCSRSVSVAWRADTSFTPAEQDAIVDGFADVGALTAGRVQTSIAWNVDWTSTKSVVGAAGGPMLVRVTSSMQPVKEADDALSAWHGHRVTVRAWTEPSPLRIYFVIDRITQLRQTAAHEMMHAAGARFPNCTSKDCDHVADGFSIMSPGIRDDVHTWSNADRALCRASCLCP